MVTKPKIRIFGVLSLLLALPAIGILISSCSNNSSPTNGNNPTPTDSPTPVFTSTPTGSTPTLANTPTKTATSTLTPTSTASATSTASPTATGTPTGTATQTATSTITSTPTVTLSPTVTSTPTTTPTTCNGTLGNDSTAEGGDSTADGIVLLFRYQAPINTTMIQLTANLEYDGGTDSSVQYGIYSDAAGPTPGTLLGSTSVFNTNDEGGTSYISTVTLPLSTPVALTAGTYYWIAFDGGNQALMDDYPDSSNSYYEWFSGSPTFVSLPTNFGSGSSFTPTGQPLFDFWGSTCP